MKEVTLHTRLLVCSADELSETDRSLVEQARCSTGTSYSPYSRFSVGAAALLDDGTVVCGSNQENAAYPSGLCAERVALFYATSQHPGRKVEALAIAARAADGFTPDPITPCGSCRQVFAELRTRYGNPMRLLLYGARHTLVVDDACSLLPLTFDAESL